MPRDHIKIFYRNSNNKKLYFGANITSSSSASVGLYEDNDDNNKLILNFEVNDFRGPFDSTNEFVFIVEAYGIDYALNRKDDKYIRVSKYSDFLSGDDWRMYKLDDEGFIFPLASFNDAPTTGILVFKHEDNDLAISVENNSLIMKELPRAVPVAKEFIFEYELISASGKYEVVDSNLNDINDENVELDVNETANSTNLKITSTSERFCDIEMYKLDKPLPNFNISFRIVKVTNNLFPETTEKTISIKKLGDRFYILKYGETFLLFSQSGRCPRFKKLTQIICRFYQFMQNLC